jgi:REP element-mobilizing transposase RayT
LLIPELRHQIFSHIREKAAEKGIYLDFINCYQEHVHLLISLNQTQTIAKIVHDLKGESSHWINQYHFSKFMFFWQEEYLAASISHSEVGKVRDYIKNQEEHHRIKTFSEEYDLFIKRYGFQKEDGRRVKTRAGEARF